MNAMNEQSLSRLYRRLVAHRAPTPSAPRVDSGAPQDVAGSAHEDALARELARAPEGAAIASLLRELQAESAALADAVNATRRRAAHPLRRTAAPRVAADRHAFGARRAPLRRLGWAGGIAAGLAVALGVANWHGQDTQRWNDVAATARSVPAPDRIFTSRDRIFAATDETHGSAGAASVDVLFRGSFAAGG